MMINLFTRPFLLEILPKLLLTFSYSLCNALFELEIKFVIVY